MPSIHDHTLLSRQGFHVSSSGSDSGSDIGSQPDPMTDPSGEPEPRWPQPNWGTQSIGRRVSVRVAAGELAPSGRPGYRDVVGVLESASEHEWVVRTRHGTTRRIEPAAVVAAKTVPDLPARLRTASDIDIASLELIAAEGWQPLEREDLGDWQLRAAEGYTGRANSVLPIGDPGVPLEEALVAVDRWYATRGITPKFQLPLPLCADLEAVLADRGWTSHHRTHVMVTDLGPLRMNVERAGPPPEVTVGIAPMADAEWRAAFRYGEDPLPASVAPILTASEHPVFITVRGSDGTTRAIGRGALTEHWLGITAIEVAEPFRRQGLGRLVIGGLATYASQHQIRHVYLQVANDSEPALALYQQLGFALHHDYMYRVMPKAEPLAAG